MNVDALLSETSVDALENVPSKREALLWRRRWLENAFWLGAHLAFVNGPAYGADSCDHGGFQFRLGHRRPGDVEELLLLLLQ